MINGESSFAEKKKRKVKVPFSSKAVDMMVKYIYGIELEDYKTLDIKSSPFDVSARQSPEYSPEC